jgi:hypothetical protein
MEENFPKVLQQLNACRLTKRMLPDSVEDSIDKLCHQQMPLNAGLAR